MSVRLQAAAQDTDWLNWWEGSQQAGCRNDPSLIDPTAEQLERATPLLNGSFRRTLYDCRIPGTVKRRFGVLVKSPIVAASAAAGVYSRSRNGLWRK
jgi:hypothetical protein